MTDKVDAFVSFSVVQSILRFSCVSHHGSNLPLSLIFAILVSFLVINGQYIVHMFVLLSTRILFLPFDLSRDLHG